MTSMRRRTGLTRRRRIGTLLSGVIAMLVVTLGGIGLVALSMQTGIRLDLTAAGEQQLSPRTRALLDSTQQQVGRVRLVVVGPISAVPARVRQEVLDVLDLVGAHPATQITTIDTASASGTEQYRALLEDLTQEHRAELDAFTGGLRLALDEADGVARWLREVLSGQLAELASAHREHAEPLERAGAIARTTARELEAQRSAWADRVITVELASLGDADAMRVQLASTLNALTTQLESIGSMVGTTESGRDLARSIARQRDQAAVSADALARLTPPPVVRAARALQQAQGVLVLAPGKVGALRFEDVFTLDAENARTDLRRTAEGAIASGLAAMLDDARPLVVLVHGEGERILDRFRIFDGMIDRLATRGIELVEWPASAGAQGRPDLHTLNPEGRRPVVYATLSPDSAARAVGNNPDTSGPARVRSLATVMEQLLAEGASMLVSLNPSILPGAGGEDPIAASLSPLGVRPRTGTPLLNESVTPQGRRALVEASALADVREHPLAQALKGLPTAFPWPIALDLDDSTAELSVESLYSLDAQNRWAETEWIRLWTTPHAQRGFVQPQPGFDPSREQNDGPWSIAAAVERQATTQRPMQRVVVVGSNVWFADGLALSTSQVDGRSVLNFPGNSELFEASVLWLAGRDGEVVPSALARSVPLVRALEESTFRWLRWGLIAGLPFGVLILGGLHRLIFG